jgi:hypothetical protein
MNTLITFILAVTPVAVFANTVASFILPSGVVVKIAEAPFSMSRFKVSGCTGSDEVCRINGHIPLGSAQQLPKTFVKEILVSYRGASYHLDASNMYDAWGKRPLEVAGIVRYFGGKCFDTKNCQFRGLFSDAAGSFVAEWKIINGLSNRTVLSDSGDLVKLFMQNIDPPEFE